MKKRRRKRDRSEINSNSDKMDWIDDPEVDNFQPHYGGAENMFEQIGESDKNICDGGFKLDENGNWVRSHGVMLRKQLVELFDRDSGKALILNQFLYWTARTDSVQTFARKELIRLAHWDMWQSIPDKYRQDEETFFKNNRRLEIEGGWVKKTHNEMSGEIMILQNTAVGNRTRELVDEGYLYKRPTEWGGDRYRVNMVKLQHELNKIDYSIHQFNSIMSDYVNYIHNSRDEQKYWSRKIDNGIDSMTDTESSVPSIINAVKKELPNVRKSDNDSDSDSSNTGGGNVLSPDDDLGGLPGGGIKLYDNVSKSWYRSYMFTEQDFNVLKASIDTNLIGKGRGGSDSSQTPSTPRKHNTPTGYIKSTIKDLIKVSQRDTKNTTRAVRARGIFAIEGTVPCSQSSQGRSASDDASLSPSASKNSKKSFVSPDDDNGRDSRQATLGNRYRDDDEPENPNAREGIEAKWLRDATECPDEYATSVEDTLEFGRDEAPDKEPEQLHDELQQLPATVHDAYLLLGEVFDEVDVTIDSLDTLFEWMESGEVWSEQYSWAVFGDRLQPDHTLVELLDRIDPMLEELERKATERVEGSESRRVIARINGKDPDEAIEPEYRPREKKLKTYLEMIKKLAEGRDLLGELDQAYRKHVDSNLASEMKTLKKRPQSVRCRMIHMIAEFGGMSNASDYLGYLADKWKEDPYYLDRWHWNSSPDIYALLCSGAISQWLKDTQKEVVRERPSTKTSSHSMEASEYDEQEASEYREKSDAREALPEGFG